jgi:hypothetical protein
VDWGPNIAVLFFDPGVLSGAALGESSLSGGLTARTELSGTAEGIAIAALGMTTEIALSGTAYGVSSAIQHEPIRFVGTAIGRASVAGALNTRLELGGAAYGVGAATLNILVGPYRVITEEILISSVDLLWLANTVSLPSLRNRQSITPFVHTQTWEGEA